MLEKKKHIQNISYFPKHKSNREKKVILLLIPSRKSDGRRTTRALSYTK